MYTRSAIKLNYKAKLFSIYNKCTWELNDLLFTIVIGVTWNYAVTVIFLLRANFLLQSRSFFTFMNEQSVGSKNNATWIDFKLIKKNRNKNVVASGHLEKRIKLNSLNYLDIKLIEVNFSTYLFLFCWFLTRKEW